MTALALVWAAAFFVEAAVRELAGWRQRESHRLPAYDWRFGTPREEGLAACLAGVANLVPAGSQVTLLDSHWDSFFRWRWAAYLLAEDDVVPAGTPEAAGSTFLVATGAEHPGQGTQVAGEPGCQLYRLR